MLKDELREKAVRMVGKKRHTFEWKNDYVMYPCPRCRATTNRDGGYCWQVQYKKEFQKIYDRFAAKYQFDIISFTENSANFKEYDGDGYIKHKYTLEDVVKDLAENSFDRLKSILQE